MKNRFNFGFSSVLISFIMICIVTFSALSLVTANADYRLSQKVANRNSSFYAAEKEAYAELAKTDDTLEAIYQEASDASEYYEAAKASLTTGTWSSEEKGEVYTWIQPIENNQYLEVSILVSYPDQYTKTYYHLLTWRTYIEEDPFEEQPLNLIGSH